MSDGREEREEQEKRREWERQEIERAKREYFRGGVATRIGSRSGVIPDSANGVEVRRYLIST